MGIGGSFKDLYDLIAEKWGKTPANLFFALIVLAIVSGSLTIILVFINFAIVPVVGKAVGLIPRIGSAIQENVTAIRLLSFLVMVLSGAATWLVLRGNTNLSTRIARLDTRTKAASIYTMAQVDDINKRLKEIDSSSLNADERFSRLSSLSMEMWSFSKRADKLLHDRMDNLREVQNIILKELGLPTPLEAMEAADTPVTPLTPLDVADKPITPLDAAERNPTNSPS